METEDTQTCTKTEAAAVKRKRRSSILKNQRPPRTPFSEVEFNVATPPDTTKSRRVSFSRRTGVAEFVTNEATTTWRNFYEEHNKSLESSGNENNLVENAPRQTIEHIGKRIFDQQFEDVEAVDLGGTIHTNPLQQFQASFNKINLTQELASLECMTGDLKFVPSQSKFEQSALTELSKPFGNDIQCPELDDMTNPISMNFTMQPLTSGKCDDLDEIQNDLERSKPSGMCSGPMNPRKDFSGYIEVADLDVTHGVIQNDGSEMSITDTIESPKVQDAAKNSVQHSKNKIDDDWTNDKENIVFNPYVAPKESLTFAVNKISDEVLVFDGKRLTTQSITNDIPENCRQTLLPDASANAPQRKSIILDVNDDLPNFIDNNSSKSSFNSHVSSVHPSDNIMAVDKQNKSYGAGNNKSIAKTIDMCDTSNMLSFTQAISSNIIAANRESLHAKHCHDMVQDISMTQPLSNNIIQMNEENNLQTDNNEKRRTIIFAGESCDMSLTQVLQSNKKKYTENISARNGNTIIFDNDVNDISMTQALPTNINVNILDDLNNLKDKDKKDATATTATSDKRKTIVFDEDSCNISMTQAVPVNIIGVNNQSNNGMGSKDLNSEKRRTIIFDHESCEISMTQALPSNINVIKENKEVTNNIVDENLPGNNKTEKRQSKIFDKESCEISTTQILLTNIKIKDNIERNNEFGKNIQNNDKSDKHRTIIFDKDYCDMSVTQALPTNINLIENLEVDENIMKNEKSEKRRTIIFDKNSCDISMTQTLPTNINLIEIFKKSNEDNKAPNENSDKLKKYIFDKESCDISMTKVLPTNIKENTEKHGKVSNEIFEKCKTIIFDKNSCDISMTQAIPSNINFDCEDIKQSVFEDNLSNEILTKRKIILFDQESCDLSMTQALPTNINIYRDSMDKDESDIKLAFKNATGIFNDIITDEIFKVTANCSQEPNKSDNKNANHLSTTEIYDDNCKSSDQTEQLKIEKIDKNKNSEMNLCKTTQPNSFRHEEDKNAKVNRSLLNSTCHEDTHVKETSYSRVNILKFDIECNDIVNSDGVKRSLEENIDQTSQYITYETDFKTNISTYYQVDKNKQTNKISMEICNDELFENMDMDKSVKLFKTIDEPLRENTINNFKSGQKKSILNELLSMSTESVKDLSKLDAKEDVVNTSKIEKENSILISTLNEPNCKESFSVENILAHDKNELDVEIKSNNSVIFMKDQAKENHTNEYFKNNEPREQSNADEYSKDKSHRQYHSKFNKEVDESVKFISESNSTNTFKSVKEADNTKDLLKMLSDITDEDGDESMVKQQEFVNNIDTQKPLTVEKNAIMTKGIMEPKRLSLAPRRQSIAISREDLLHNISMAKAALQQSRFEVDETEIMDDTSELIQTHEINDTHKSNRMSSEVVKTLQFEDESASDASFKSEIRMTPLRKSANDEITSVYDKKAKVIPTSLIDFPGSLKELMHDLVKPNSDAPFENNFSETNEPSTCNVEVEANLITSSQIDVSQKDLIQCVLKNSDSFISKGETKNVGLEVDSVILLNDFKSSVTDFKPITAVQHTIDEYTSPPKSKHQSIVFNSENPLKNIILPPIDYSDAHRYNRLKEVKSDDDTANKSRQPPCKMIELDTKSSSDQSFENDLLKEQKITEKMNIVCGQSSNKRSGVSDTNDSISKLTNVDTSVNSVASNVKDTESMNNELEMNIEPSTEPSKETDIIRSKTSPVKILFRNENNTEITEIDPDAASSDEICKVDLDPKIRKRSYSPTSTNSYVASNVDVTPKPISKMQKMSNSPLTKSTNHTIDSEIMQVDEEEAISPKCDKSTINSAARTEIVQKVDIEYNTYCKLKSRLQISQSAKVDGDNALQSKECSKQLSFSSESIQEPSATISQIVSSVTSRIVTSEEEAKNVETDAGPDVIDAIKLLSFMDTSECEWERRACDAWCFRLLCRRVRLRVRLHSAAVSDCTPVTAVDVEIAKADARDPIAGMCVSLAVDAMRYEAAEVLRVDAVAALLRRCVRVARLARRWARAMRDAHARLAYNVLPDGHISLKVANLPLRRVVEARLHVSLAVGRERGAAYPCADRLTLAAQGAGQEAGPDLARLADQPPDWGHVPRTIWKVFKYLKNRTRPEELLGI